MYPRQLKECGKEKDYSVRLFSNLSSPLLTVILLEEDHSPHFRDEKIEAWGSETYK